MEASTQEAKCKARRGDEYEEVEEANEVRQGMVAGTKVYKGRRV